MWTLPRLHVAGAILLAVAAFLLAVPGAGAARYPAPVAGGDSAANMQLSGSEKWVLTRWVARASGTLQALHLRIQADGSTCRLSGRTGYGSGSGGSWRVTTHPVLPDGRPDRSTTLSTTEFRPCEGPESIVDVRQGVVRVPLGIKVRRGQELATIVRNTDPNARVNFTSPNFLYVSSGLVGAQARNERSPLASDVYYGLDPRELVGYSTNGGATWALPGGQYGNPGGRNFLPTYIQEYAGGKYLGQPFYYTASPTTGQRTMLFRNIRSRWTISQLGAYTTSAGSGTLTLEVNGRVRARADVSGHGMLRKKISAVTVSRGQAVRVTSSGLPIRNVVADTAWGRLMGMHLATSPWLVVGEANFTHAAPIYALPAYDPQAPVLVARRAGRGGWVATGGDSRKRKSPPRD